MCRANTESLKVEEALTELGLDCLASTKIGLEFVRPLLGIVPSWKEAIASATVSSRRTDLRQFAKWCIESGCEPLAGDEALRLAVEAYMYHVGRKFTPSTVKHIGFTLSSFCKALGSVPGVKAAKIGRVQSVRSAHKRIREEGKQREPLYLSVSQMKEMREAILSQVGVSNRAIRDLAIFDLSCDLLANRGAIVRLKGRDIDTTMSTVSFYGSGGKRLDQGSVFALSKPAVLSLQDWLDLYTKQAPVFKGAVNDGDDLPVFVNMTRTGKIQFDENGVPVPISGAAVVGVFERCAESLHIKGITGNTMRRSMARALFVLGISEEEIVRKGRWSSVKELRDHVNLPLSIAGAAGLISL